MKRVLWFLATIVLSVSALGGSAAPVTAAAESTMASCSAGQMLTDADVSDIAWLNSTDELSHGGGLNACGCHFNRRTGGCHCHRPRGCGCQCQPATC
jgi:hypothetical protein